MIRVDRKKTFVTFIYKIKSNRHNQIIFAKENSQFLPKS